MPRYDYRCTACADVFEIEHGMRERPEVACPVCGAPAERVLNASGIVFKGSGFYNTDQRGKKGGTEATSGPAGETGGAAASSEKGTESAPSAGKGAADSSSAPAACAAAPACGGCAAKAEAAKA